MARLRSGRAFGLAAGALAAALETAQPTAASMGLFGRAGTRANGTDRSPVRSRAGACSRVRRGYGLVAARENSLWSCRGRILRLRGLDASLICRRCGRHRLVKTFVVLLDYPRRRTLALLLDYPRCRTLCWEVLLDYPRCRTLCWEVLLDHPRCRCSPNSLRHHLHCHRLRHHPHRQRQRHHHHRHPVLGRAVPRM